jgi:hypothetical protein
MLGFELKDLVLDPGSLFGLDQKRTLSGSVFLALPESA